MRVFSEADFADGGVAVASPRVFTDADFADIDASATDMLGETVKSPAEQAADAAFVRRADAGTPAAYQYSRDPITGAPAGPTPGLATDIGAALYAAGGDVVSGIQRLQAATQSRPDLAATSSAAADTLNRTVSQTLEQKAAADEAVGRGLLGSTVTGAARSLATTVPTAFVAGPAGAIAGAVGTTANQATTTAADQGMDPGQATRYVATQAIIEGVPAAIMQRFGMGGMESLASNPVANGVFDALKKAGISTLYELPEELVTTIGQQLSNGLEGVDPSALTYEGMRDASRDTVLQTLLAGGAMGGVSAASSMRQGQPPVTPPPVPTANPKADLSVDDVLAFANSPEAQPQAVMEPVSDAEMAALPEGPPIPSRVGPTNAAPQVQRPGYTPNMRTIRDKWGRVSPEAFNALFPEAKDNAAYVPEGVGPDVESTPFGTQADRNFYPSKPPVVVGTAPISEGSAVRRNAVVSPGFSSDAAPNVESVPFGTQSDGGMSPQEALGVLAGVDMRTPDATVDAATTAMQQTPAPKAPSVEMRAIDALYQMAAETGSMQPIVDEQSILDIMDEFEPTERKSVLATWREANAAWNALTPEQQAVAQSYILPAQGPMQPEESAPASPVEPQQAAPTTTTAETPTVPVAAAPEPIPAPVTPKEKARARIDERNRALAAVFDKYDNTGESTGDDFVNEVEALIGSGQAPKSLRKLVDKYRTAKEEHRKAGYRMDSGDQEIDSLAEAVRAQLAKGDNATPTSNIKQSTKATVDVAPILSAATENELFEIGGRMLSGEKSDANTSAIQAAMKQRAAEIATQPQKEVQLEERQQGEGQGRQGSSPENVLSTEPVVVPQVATGSTTKRQAPQRPGTTSASGWKLAGKGLWRKDIGGRSVEVVRNADKTFSVLRDEVEVDAGYKTSQEAQAYADGELAQDIADEQAWQEEVVAEVAPKPTPRRTNIGKQSPDDGLAEWKKAVKTGGVKMTPDVSEDNMGGKLPPGVLKKNATTSYDQWLEVAREYGLDVGNGKPEDFRRLMLTKNTEQSAAAKDKAAEAFALSKMSGDAQAAARLYGGIDNAVEALKGQREILAQNGQDTTAVDAVVDELDPSVPKATEKQQNEFDWDTGETAAEKSEREFNELWGIGKADTGILRDIEAAAQQGRKFVADLHERMKPTLSRIAQVSTDVKQFVSNAVSALGEQIRPYATRFVKEARRIIAEYKANPERGAAMKPTEILKALRAEYRQGAKDRGREAEAEKKSAKAESVAEERERGKAVTEKAVATTQAKADAKVDKLIERADKAEDAAHREGVKDGRKLGQRYEQMTNKEMLKLIENTLDSKDLQAVKTALRSLATNTTLSADAREKRLRKLLLVQQKRLDKARAVKSATKAIDEAKSKFKKLRPEIQDALNDIMAGFKVKGNTAKAITDAQTLVQNLQNMLLDGQFSPGEVKRAQEIVNNVSLPALRDMDVQQIREIRNAVESLLELNDAMFKEGLLKALKAKRDKNRTVAVADIEDKFKGAKDVDPEDRRMGSALLRGMRNSAMSLDNITREVSKAGSYIRKVLVDNLMLADIKADNLRAGFYKELQAALKEAGITTKDITEISYIVSGDAAKRKRAKTRKIDLANGSVNLTGAEVVSILNQLRDPDTRYQLMKTGYKLRRNNAYLKITPENAEAIESAATDTERALADIMFNIVNGDARDVMNKAWVDLFGYEIAGKEPYYPRRREQSDKEPGSSLFGGDISGAQAEANSIVKPRTGGKDPIILEDAFQQLSAHFEAVAAIAGKLEASMDARRLLDTKQFKDAIEAKHKDGKFVLSELGDRVRRWGRLGAGSSSDDIALRVVKNLQRNISTAGLSLAAPVIISQSFSVTSAAKVIPAKFINKTWGKITDSRSAKEIAQYSATLNNIMNGTGHNVVNPGSTTAVSAQEMVGINLPTLSDKAMVAIQFSNDIAVLNVWRAARAWGESKGLEGEALMEFTADKATEAWLKTQPSNSKVFASGARLRAEDSAAWAAVTMFQSQTSIQFQDAVSSIYDYLDKPKGARTAKDRLELAVGLTRPMLFQAILFNLIKYTKDEGWAYLFDESEEEKKKQRKWSRTDEAIWNNVIDSTVGQVPVYGPMAKSTAEYLRRYIRKEGTFNSSPIDVPLADTGQVAADGVTSAIALLSGDVSEKAIRGVAKAASLGTGLPIEKVRSVAFDAIEATNRL